MSEPKDNKDNKDNKEDKNNNDNKELKETKARSESKSQSEYRYKDLRGPDFEEIFKRFREFLEPFDITLDENWNINHKIVLSEGTKGSPDIIVTLLGFTLGLRNNQPRIPTIRGMPDPNKAIAQKHYERIVRTVKSLLEKGADVNAPFLQIYYEPLIGHDSSCITTPLIISFIREHEFSDIILPLIQAGADVNLPGGMVMSRDPSSPYHRVVLPPLIAAIVSEGLKSPSTLRILIEKGAQLTASPLKSLPPLQNVPAYMKQTPSPAKETPLDALQSLQKGDATLQGKFKAIAPEFYRCFYLHALQLYSKDQQSTRQDTSDVLQVATGKSPPGVTNLIMEYAASDLSEIAAEYLLGKNYSLTNDSVEFFTKILMLGQQQYEAEEKHKKSETAEQTSSAQASKTSSTAAQTSAAQTPSTSEPKTTLTFSGAGTSAAAPSTSASTSSSPSPAPQASSTESEQQKKPPSNP